MSVDLKCPRALTKTKSMLDDYKRNVLPGATYSYITFLLTTIRGKNYISHLKRTAIPVLTSYVAFLFSPTVLSIPLPAWSGSKEKPESILCIVL